MVTMVAMVTTAVTMVKDLTQALYRDYKYSSIKLRHKEYHHQTIYTYHKQRNNIETEE